MVYFREIIAWLFVFVIPMTLGKLSQNRRRNCCVPMSQNFAAHFADIFASISQLFGAFFALLYGRLKGLFQKAAGCSERLAACCDTVGKSQKTELSGGSLKSGILSNSVSAIKAISLAVVFVFISLLSDAAKTTTWIPTNGGAWTTAGNWNNGLPVAGDDVIINSDQTAAITSVPAISLTSLTINGDCSFTAGTAGNLITITGTFTVASGKTLDEGGTRPDILLDVTATGTIDGTVAIRGPARDFTNNGNLTITASGLITGVGIFNLGSGATLQIGSTAGITTAGATGNIQTTTRTYSTGANYVYNGTSAQVTGTGLTQNTPANITINNPGNTVTLSANTNMSGILTVKAGSSLALGANSLGTPTSVVLENGSTASTISGTGALTLGGDVAVNYTSGSGTGALISCPVALGTATRTFTVADEGAPANTDLKVSGIISGARGITKAGTGMMLLSGANTYTGTTTINTGVLKIQGVAFSTTPRSYSISSGAVMNIDGNTGVAAGNSTISGTGTLRITGSSGTMFGNEGSNLPKGNNRNIAMSLGFGALIDVQSGAEMLNGGWQNITWTNNYADLNVDGIFDIWDGQTVIVDALTGSGTVDKNNGYTVTVGLTVGQDNGTGTFSGIIKNTTDITTLTKTGNGTQILSGTNTYTGTTTISAGTLSINTLQNVSGGGSSLGAPTTTANGTIAIGATGILQYTGSGHSSDRVINITADGGTIDASGSGTLTLSGGVTGTNNNLALTGTGQGVENGVINTSAATVTKNGSGTWTLSGVNTYTGATTINAGVLSVGTIGIGGAAGNLGAATNAAANLVLSGGTLQYTGASATTNRNFTLFAGSTSTIDITNSLTISGASTNTTGALTKIGAGTLTLSGAQLLHLQLQLLDHIP